MSDHISCPNCHNTSEGTSLYVCGHCGQVYCSACEPSGYEAICHACHSPYHGSYIGRINRN